MATLLKIHHQSINSKHIIIGNSPAVSSCSPALCASCKIECLTHRTPKSSHIKCDSTQLMSISKNDLRIGQTVSMNRHISSTPGRLQCSPALCASCKIECLTHRTPKSSHIKCDSTQLMSISKNDLRIGQTDSINRHISSTPGRLQHTRRKESAAMKFLVKHFLWIAVQSLSFSKIKYLLVQVKIGLVNRDLSQYFAFLVLYSELSWR